MKKNNMKMLKFAIFVKNLLLIKKILIIMRMTMKMRKRKKEKKIFTKYLEK